MQSSIRSNALLALGAEATAGLCTAILTLYLVRNLGPSAFGIFSLALSIGAVVLLPAEFGLSQSVARLLVERGPSREARAAVLGRAIRVKVCAAAIVAAALFALAGPIADAYGLPALTWPLRAMAVAVFSQAVFGLFRSSLEALGRMGSDWIVAGGESVSELIAAVVLVAAGSGAAGAVWGRAIGYTVGVGLGLALAARLLGPRVLRPGGMDRPLVRGMIAYGSALLVIDGGYALFSQIDVLLLGAILGADASGVYAAPLRLVALFLYPAAAITAAVAPRLGRVEGRDPDVGPLETGISLLLAVGMVTVVPLLVWADPLMETLLGSGYGESAQILRALTPFILVSGIARLLTTSVNYYGEARRRIGLIFFCLALNVGLDLFLIRRIGVIGAAIGNDIAFIAYAIGHLYICRRLMGLPLRSISISLGRCLVAGAVMAAVLLLVGHGDHVGVFLLVVGLLSSAIVFGVMLRALGEPLVAELTLSVPGSGALWRIIRRR